MVVRKPLIAANWKMNGTLSSIRPLLAQILGKIGSAGAGAVEVAIFPPSVYLAELAKYLVDSDNIKFGAQNVSYLNSGAHTGEISVAMLQDFGCAYVIVGHSERRYIYGEGEKEVARKFQAVVHAGIQPILCVGERIEERDGGNTEEVVARQLDTVIDLVGIEAFRQAVVAYEPVWAIGTGKTAAPEQAEEVHEFIRLRLARHDVRISGEIRILYGGSIRVDNAVGLFSMANVDGGLIGGASLRADDFIGICQAAG